MEEGEVGRAFGTYWWGKLIKRDHMERHGCRWEGVWKWRLERSDRTLWN